MSRQRIPTLPDEIIAAIFLCLPAKQIGRARCVSKPWKAFLTSSRFAEDHLKHHKENNSELILSSSTRYGPYILSLSDGHNGGGVATQVNFRFEPFDQPVVLGSCNGLILLSLDEFRKMVINPVTLQAAEIWDVVHFYKSSSAYGFGYDGSKEDYKIVILTYSSVVRKSFVYIYSLKVKQWKKLSDPSYAFGGLSYDYKDTAAPGVYLNGYIHWYGDDLLCFDLAREEFVQGILPDSFDKSVVYDVRVLQGCLALVSPPDYIERDGVTKKYIPVWVMKEHRVQESWTKITIVCRGGEADVDAEINVVCDLKKEGIVLERNFRRLVSYNVKNMAWRDLDIAGLPNHQFHRVMSFTGSLLSPN